MSAKILDGKKVSKEILLKLCAEVATFHDLHIYPKLAVILVGKDPASIAYVAQKQHACAFTGIEWEQYDFEEDVAPEILIGKINMLNADVRVHGILVQLPLPSQIDEAQVIRSIYHFKDVDGFTPRNLGSLVAGAEFEDLAPCTPLGVIRLLEHYGILLEGANVCVVGQSKIVGKPLGLMLANRNATVTNCHIFTKNLKEHTLRADILCVAAGKRGLISADMVKEGAVVVDIGFNRSEDGALTGDVDFAEVSKKASYITPVPGGVGPMTVACLMENTIKAAKWVL